MPRSGFVVEGRRRSYVRSCCPTCPCDARRAAASASIGNYAQPTRAPDGLLGRPRVRLRSRPTLLAGRHRSHQPLGQLRDPVPLLRKAEPFPRISGRYCRAATSLEGFAALFGIWSSHDAVPSAAALYCPRALNQPKAGETSNIIVGFMGLKINSASVGSRRVATSRFDRRCLRTVARRRRRILSLWLCASTSTSSVNYRRDELCRRERLAESQTFGNTFRWPIPRAVTADVDHRQVRDNRGGRSRSRPAPCPD